MRDRDDWVDCAKGIGIVLVVYGHVARGLANAGLALDPYWFRLADGIVYSFHMPLFFFLAGIFFRASLARHGGPGLIAGKVDSIVYPYVLWSLLQGLCEVALSHYTNGHVGIDEVLAFAWRPRAQFWFLYALFQIFALATLLYSRASPRHLPALAAGAAALYLVRLGHPLDDALAYVANNLVFFALGIWFNEWRDGFAARRGLAAAILVPLCAAAQYVFHVALGLDYRAVGPASLALAALSILAVVALSMLLARLHPRWLLFIGASSMSIYLMHILVGSGTRVVLQKFLGIDSAALHLLLGTAVGLGAPLLAQALIRRYRLGFLLSAPPVLSLARLRSRRSAAAVGSLGPR